MQLLFGLIIAETALFSSKVLKNLSDDEFNKIIES